MATILVVDDDMAARELAASVLIYAGHTLRTCGDAGEALLDVQARPPDLVIADLLMPTMDGFEFVRRLREQPAFAGTPVIFYTATYLESEARNLALACGVRHFISKPAEPQQIIDVVSAVLGEPPGPLALAPPEDFHREHVSVLMAKLSQKAAQAVPRLGAMINLSLQIASERDPAHLLGEFCTSARKIIGARYAIVSVLERDRTRWRAFFTSGMEPAVAHALATVPPDAPDWRPLLEERRTRRVAHHAGTPGALGLPANHPPVHSLLAAPIASPERVYGWLCLTDKIASEEFNDEDEGLAQILAAQVGRIYENGSLYAEIKRHADELEREIAERTRAEQSFGSLVEAAQDAIFTINPQREITSLNPMFETITGWARADWLGRSFLPLVHPDDAARSVERFEKTMRGEKLDPIELRLATRAQTYVVLEFKVAPLARDGRITALLGIGRDVTERKRLEEQFRQAQKMDSIGRLAGGVAHDFNNLLTVINGCAELLLAGAGPRDSPESLLNDIRKAGTRAAALTHQLLAFSRQSAAAPVALDLNSVVANLEKMLRRLIGEDVELATRLAPALGRTLLDPVQVEQVVMNLVVNARDAMPQGGTLLIETADAEVAEPRNAATGVLEPGRFVCLSVADSGTGMTDEVKARIFEPFFTTKEVGRGTGLGLATVYGIVKQSGGQIFVQSTVGQGTRFEIYLPRLEGGGTQAAADVQAASAPTGRESILVVEDDDGIRRLMRIALESFGYTVHEAHNGEEALALAQAKQRHFDVLISDVIMPRMNGPTLAEALRALRPDMRVLFVSGHAGDALTRHAPALKPRSLLPKPFTLPTLARRVRETLDAPA